MDYSENIPTCGEWKLLKHLDPKKEKLIFAAYHGKKKYICALKIYPKGEKDNEEITNFISNEAEMVNKFDHSNIIKRIQFKDDAIYTPNPANEISYKVSALAIELAENGSIFDFIFTTGGFTEDIARYYFYDLIEAVKEIHEKGVMHRDIKLENLVLDEDFKLKVIDFEYSSYEEMSEPKTGTTRYLPPEAHKGMYDGKKADLFACGVCLFMMVTRKNPFEKASRKNREYANLMKGKIDKFWAKQLKRIKKEKDFLSDDFKELVNGLLNPNIDERWNIDQVRESDWMRKDNITDKKLLEEMKERKSNLNNSEGEEMPDRPDGDDMSGIFKRSGRNRGIGDDGSGEEEDQDFFTPRMCDRFIPWYRIYTSIFSTEDIEYLWGILVSSCSQAANELNFIKGKYEVEMIIVDEEDRDEEESEESEESDEDEEEEKEEEKEDKKGEESIKISANILEVNSGTHCVEFSLIKGDRSKFQEIYEDIKDYFGGLANVKAEQIEELYKTGENEGISA